MRVFKASRPVLLRSMFAIAGLVLASACTVADEVSEDDPSRTTWDGVYTEVQAERGQQVIDQHCATCHGNNLFGSRAAPAIAGIEMLFVWDGRTLAELLDTMSNTMPPGQVGSIAEEAFVDVMATMLRSSGFPSTEKTELPVLATDLQHVVIKREKPQ